MPMSTVRTFTGNPRDLVDPAFRIVNFRDDPDVVHVSTLIRRLWLLVPLKPYHDGTHDKSDFGTVLQDIGAREAAGDVLPQTEDRTVDTPWRDMLHGQWNHVYWDVMQFLREVGYGVGHFHPPNHQVFSVSSTLHGEAGGGLRKSWETNVLIAPTFLAPGVEVKVYVLDRTKGDLIPGVDTAEIMARAEQGLPLLEPREGGADQPAGGVGNEVEGGEAADGEEALFKTDASQSEEAGGCEKELIGTFDSENLYEVWYIRSGVEIEFEVCGSANEPADKDGLVAVFVTGILCTNERAEQ